MLNIKYKARDKALSNTVNSKFCGGSWAVKEKVFKIFFGNKSSFHFLKSKIVNFIITVNKIPEGDPRNPSGISFNDLQWKWARTWNVVGNKYMCMITSPNALERLNLLRFTGIDIFFQPNSFASWCHERWQFGNWKFAKRFMSRSSSISFR